MNHPIGSAETVFLESKAKQVQKRLKSEVRIRKRQGFVAFADGMVSKSLPEAMRQMSSIKRRVQDPGRVPGPGLSVDNLNAYADYFARTFRSERGKAHPIAKGRDLQTIWDLHITSYSKQ